MAIRSRKHQHRVNSLAALVAAAIPGIGYVHAEQAKEGYALPEMVVTEQKQSTYKADRSASAKLAEPLLDTPKTVQVIRKEMLREQGANNLMEALRNTPGITMQLGENGNTAAGYTFMMRGFSTQNSTFVYGVTWAPSVGTPSTSSRSRWSRAPRAPTRLHQPDHQAADAGRLDQRHPRLRHRRQREHDGRHQPAAGREFRPAPEPDAP